MWSLTPRQIKGYLELATRRQIAERASLLAVTALAAQGTGEAIKEQINRWEQES